MSAQERRGRQLAELGPVQAPGRRVHTPGSIVCTSLPQHEYVSAPGFSFPYCTVNACSCRQLRDRAQWSGATPAGGARPPAQSPTPAPSPATARCPAPATGTCRHPGSGHGGRAHGGMGQNGSKKGWWVLGLAPRALHQRLQPARITKLQEMKPEQPSCGAWLPACRPPALVRQAPLTCRIQCAQEMKRERPSANT